MTAYPQNCKPWQFYGGFLVQRELSPIVRSSIQSSFTVTPQTSAVSLLVNFFQDRKPSIELPRLAYSRWNKNSSCNCLDWQFNSVSTWLPWLTVLTAVNCRGWQSHGSFQNCNIWVLFPSNQVEGLLEIFLFNLNLHRTLGIMIKVK